MIGELCALATACCWSGSSIAFAEATLRAGTVRVNVTRLFLAAILLLLTIVLFAIPVNVSPSQMQNLALSGFLGLVFGDTFLFKSYEYNGARISSLVMSAAPAISAFFAYFLLGETLSIAAVIGMTVTTAGIVLVVAERTSDSKLTRRITTLGILYAFLGACGQAGGLITAKMALNAGPINGLTATFLRIISGLVFLIPLAAFTGRLFHPLDFFRRDRKALGLTFLGAVLGPYIGITCSLISIEYTKVAVAATIMATVPMIMLPLVRIVYREKLTWRAYAGAVVTVAGVAILFLR